MILDRNMEMEGTQERMNRWINRIEYWLFKMIIIMSLVFEKYIQLKCMRIITQKTGGVNIIKVVKLLDLPGKWRKKFVIALNQSMKHDISWPVITQRI